MRESPGGTRLPGGGGRAAKLSLKGGGMLLPSVTPLEPPPPPHGCFLHIITLPGPEVVPHPWRHQSEGTEL